MPGVESEAVDHPADHLFRREFRLRVDLSRVRNSVLGGRIAGLVAVDAEGRAEDKPTAASAHDVGDAGGADDVDPGRFDRPLAGLVEVGAGGEVDDGITRRDHAR